MGLFNRKEPREPEFALRVETSGGETWNDPTEDRLLTLLEDLTGEGDYFMVVRLADPSDQTYAQVLRTADGYLVERRRGSEGSHEHARTTDPGTAHQALTTWSFELDGPDELTWHPGFG
jgi:hypothetical protein